MAYQQMRPGYAGVVLPFRHAPNTLKPLDTDDANNARVISPQGNLVIEYQDSSAVSHRWKVSSQLLMDKSPYFQALLDPEKFAEGRLFAQQRQNLNEDVNSHHGTGLDLTKSSPHTLPTFKITADKMLEICGVDAVELFLQIMCLEPFLDEGRVEFEDSLKSRSPSLIARLIEVADWFNSPRFIRNTLRGVGYMFGQRHRSPPGTFNPALLKMKEDRIRQSIIIAHFLQFDLLFETMTHTLLVAGSRFWADGPQRPDTEHLRWRYLPDGIEEELYHRRQCVLNTITDLHAYFLRKYGALEDTDETKPPSNTGTSLGVAFSTSTQTRKFQCRAGLDNASQCDLFHLGQMTRFFSMRAKTVFIGSTLIDPDFGDDSETEHTNEQRPSSTPSDPPSDITTIIASLKQYPDYQIDPNHQACGVRRRLLPIIPCIEKYISDPRSILGIDRQDWDQQPRLWTWKGNPQNDHSVAIRFAQITDIQSPSRFPLMKPVLPKDEARFLFTAKKRNWEA